MKRVLCKHFHTHSNNSSKFNVNQISRPIKVIPNRFFQQKRNARPANLHSHYSINVKESKFNKYSKNEA